MNPHPAGMHDGNIIGSLQVNIASYSIPKRIGGKFVPFYIIKSSHSFACIGIPDITS